MTDVRIGTLIIDEQPFAMFAIWLDKGRLWTKSRRFCETPTTISDQPTMVLLDPDGVEVTRWRSTMAGWSMSPGNNYEFTWDLSIWVNGTTGVGGFG